jgi:hypothetical protein
MYNMNISIGKDEKGMCNESMTQCITCRKTKSRVQPHELYTLLTVPTEPWVDISMNFVLGLSRSKKGRLFFRCCW